MTYQPSPLQTLFLWRLLCSEGGEFCRRMRPELPAPEKRSLVAAGLIELESRRDAANGRAARPAQYAVLTELGWEWASRHLDAEISMRSHAAAGVLLAIMRKLKTHLARQRISLAEFICSQPSGTCAVGQPDLISRMRAAYREAAGGRWNVRVRLADLRRMLPDVPRQQLDAALLALEREPGTVLYSLDDPQEIRPEDESAALGNSAGTPRHIVYIEE